MMSRTDCCSTRTTSWVWGERGRGGGGGEEDAMDRGRCRWQWMDECKEREKMAHNTARKYISTAKEKSTMINPIAFIQ
jgi:hypothetical protein